jgi:Zn-dependent alcohol dehydrogenase
VLVVGQGTSLRSTLGLTSSKSSKVIATTPANIYRAAFWTRDVSVIVVDVDNQGLAMLHDLHILFPDLKIVAVTKSPKKEVAARRYGAAAVVIGSTASSTDVVRNTVRAMVASYTG